MRRARNEGGVVVLIVAAILALSSAARARAEILQLECRWSERFDTSTNQKSEASGLATYTIELHDGPGRMRRAGLDAPFRVDADAGGFSARAEHRFDGYIVQEFVRIDRRTGAIEAWTMMGDAGGAFKGHCRSTAAGVEP